MFKDFSRKYLSPFAAVSFCSLAAAVIIKLFAVLFSPFADFFNRYVSFIPRAVFSYVTAPIPFSLAEAIIIAAVPLALIYLIFCATAASNRKLWRHVINLLGTVCLALSFFIINFGIAYDCTPIEKKLGMETDGFTAYDVFEAGKKVIAEINSLEDEIKRNKDGEAVSPYTFDEMKWALVGEYDKAAKEHDFISPLLAPPKRIALSMPMRYTGIVGVYTFFTGEANVNVYQSSYAVCFTAAHEMAHQRGIAPEDEANFVAFLTLYNSDVPFFKYAGLMEVFNYMANALYRENEELYYDLLATFTEGMLKEYALEQENSAQFYDNVAEDISNAVNDAYLKLQGQAEGSKSYGLVTDLATAFFLNK